MPVFSYVGIDAQGKRTQGTLQAENLSAARQALGQLSLQVTELAEAMPSPPPFDLQTANLSAPTTNIAPPVQTGSKSYFSLVDTLRLYAGWLLAWYLAVFILGSYQFFWKLPWTVPYVDELFLSPNLLQFACAVFLFLLFTSIHKLLGRGMLTGLLLTVVAFGVFVFFRANI